HRTTATRATHTLSLHDALPIFVALRIGEPRAHARDVAREDTGADRRVAADVCEVRTGGAMRRRPADHVAAYAHLREENAIAVSRSEEHTSELQSLAYLVCRLLL